MGREKKDIQAQMDKREKTGFGVKSDRFRRAVELIFILLLILYPMRHVTWGGDLWDIGYNYGNFEFGDIDSMGKMWFFSTYFANAVGHVLTLLPFGHTVLGLNVYTGLFASLLSVMGYWFCTRKLEMPKAAVFAGEWIALSLCWCPTALLYNYITYVLFTASIILLYQGLKNGRAFLLVLAGCCLGTNVFVRFSNLPEMGLIVAVWAYDFWTGWELRREREGWLKESFRRMAGDTLLCLSGYLGAVAVFALWIQLHYGMSQYIEGIRLLFSMTETASDYKPTSMLYGIFWPFKESLQWLKKMAVFLLAGVLTAFAADYAPLCLKGKKGSRREAGGRQGKAEAARGKKGGRREAEAEVAGGRQGGRRGFRLAGVGICFVLTVIFVYWLYLQREDPAPNFTTYYYTSYDPIFWPGTVFLLLAMGIGAIDIVRKGASKEERFWGLGIILLLLLTSLGSNNLIYPSMNHLFLAAPYVLDRLVRFTRWSSQRARREIVSWETVRLNFLPAAAMLWAFTAVCLIQFTMFGALFSFCEGTGLQEKGASVSANAVLKGMEMSGERARWLSELSAFAGQQEFAGREAILHGNLPALSFYLQVKPAFHSWNDLDSFRVVTMQETVEELASKISGGRDCPLVIADKKYAAYGPVYSAAIAGEQSGDEKWELIRRFMELCGDGEHFGYQKVFENERFVVWDVKSWDK